MSTTLTDPGRLLGWIAAADRILVGAGAGLSAAAGFDVMPGMDVLEGVGLRQASGRTLPEPVLWARWFRHVVGIRSSPPARPVYDQLRHLLADKDYFVHTSNVDALFIRSGFSPDRVHTPQGDCRLLQCASACTRQVWDVRPFLDRALAVTGATGDVAADEAVVPRCPVCAGPMAFNVRVDARFIGDHYVPTRRALAGWLHEGHGKSLLIIELGAGFNAAVVRRPMETIARTHRAARIVRINRNHPQLPTDLAARGAAISADIGDALAAMQP